MPRLLRIFLVACLSFSAAMARSTPSGPLSTLTSIAKVRSLSFEEANRKYPVRLQAVVVFFDPVSYDLFMHDETGAIWMGWTPDSPKVAVGDLIEVQATTTLTDFAPDLFQPRLKILGRGQLPQARKVSFEQMVGTSEDSEWVEVEGIVRQAEYLHRTSREKQLWMRVAIPGGMIEVQIPWDGSPVPAGLVDARVRLRGACGAQFNAEEQQVGVSLSVPSLQYVEILEPPRPDPLVGAPTPIGQLQRFGYPHEPGHRLRLAGTITAVMPGQGFYLEDHSGSVNVVSRQAIDLWPGDRVETLGFVGIVDMHVRLEDAVTRRISGGSPSPTKKITVEQALSGQYESRAVTIEGQVVGRSSLPRQQTLVLQQKQNIFPVVASGASVGELPSEGAQVQVSGICVGELDSSGKIIAFKIIARSNRDIVVIQEPPWWNLRRLLGLLGLVGVASSLILVWVFVLRRRVGEQTRLISQKLAQEESLKNAAEMASRTKSEFLANMSHEIRTPMNAIVGFTDLLLETPLNEEQRDYVNTVQFSSHSLTRILNDILDFSKIEAGQLSLEEIPFSLSNCLQRVLQLVTPEASRKNIATRVAIDDAVCDDLIGDPYRLHQVLLNLLNNALKFTEGGQISVIVCVTEAMRDAVVLQISVSDTGIGIPYESQTKIFESFRQADGSMTRKYGGTGLGLAICGRLVHLFGGKIWVESVPGEGSTFRFTARFVRKHEEGAHAQAEDMVSGTA